MNQSAIIKIDVDKILQQRLPRYYRFIPKFIIRYVERTICQERLNNLLEKNRGKTGADFCRGVLHNLNIKIKTTGEALLPPLSTRRVVIVSNHPLGGLDGIAYIDYISKLYGGKIHFIVNDLLMAIKPLNDVFLPINKHGKQSRQSYQAIEKAFAGDDPIIIFPAGLVSRRNKNGGISDLRWQKMFINKCIEYQRDVIPMFFSGENSPFFYKFAKLRVRLGIKFNIEMIYLPREMFQNENATFTISIGSPINWQQLKYSKNSNAQEKADEIKDIVYNLKP